MTFRTRLVLTLSAITAVTMAAAFGAASFVVVRSEERQLDEALRAEAKQEAAEIANEGRGKALRISDRGGPQADDVGRLTKYAVLYREDGTVLDSTDTFGKSIPQRRALPATAMGAPFDLQLDKDTVRAIVQPVPGGSGALLLLAASLEDLEKDTDFLRRVMLLSALLSIGLTVLATWRVVRQLTRGHLAIAAAAHRVAAGDLEARVALTAGDDEVVQLARDVDEMVQRLAILVDSQQRFVAHAAHELRSPLTALYGELQHALRRSRSAEEYRTAIEESLDSTRRLKMLAEDLLAIARTAAEKEDDHNDLSVDEVVRQAASWAEPDAKRREIVLDIEIDGSLVVGRALDLERLVRNLLDNAVRHSPRGGTVRVRATTHDGTVEVDVSDEGPGVAPSDRERIFEPFFRAAAERTREGGSGLGLAIVREIARAHGGDVEVDAGPNGKGALFRVRLRASSKPRLLA